MGTYTGIVHLCTSTQQTYNLKCIIIYIINQIIEYKRIYYTIIVWHIKIILTFYTQSI